MLVDDAGEELTSWNVEVPWPPDVATVDLLARWQLVARRGNRTMYVLEAPAALLDLIALCGLRTQILGER
ncbi:MAG TPA: hypothetical protein VHE83_17020 [Mycobacteriales bacterium]|nr:hypothetical protein [Mycobacteriales bacterium]